MTQPRTPKALAFTRPSDGKKYLVSMNLDTSLTTTQDYDNVTGIGSMNYDFALAISWHGR
ncbi:hypothetical protein AAGW05_04175 [Arthrobacter sp. LAPM80]|uniref:hypothetical protein n=1 Tax=Arthrobacter sp. LAPM80 TaxID=3141788 RepID=UPI00398B6C38